MDETTISDSTVQESLADEENWQQPNITGYFLEMAHPNAYDFNLQQIHLLLIEYSGAQDGKIVIHNTVGRPAVDFLFSPSGEIMNIRLTLSTLQEYGVLYEYVIERVPENLQGAQGMLDFFTESRSDIAGLDMYYFDSYEFDPELDSIYTPLYDYARWPAFVSWYAATDLQAIIDEYTVGSPAVYRFSSRDLTKDELAQPGLNAVFLDCTGGRVQELDYPALTPAVPGEDYPSITFRDYYYYVIEPYYLQDGTLTGLDEKTLSHNGENPHTYIANNLIVLLVPK